MARRGFMSWLTGGAIESVRDVPILGWIVDKVVPDTPIEQSKKAAEKEARKVPKGTGPKRKKVPPKPTPKKSKSTSKPSRTPSSPSPSSRPSSVPRTPTARDLQVQFSNPFATRAEREKAMRKWLKMHPRPGDAGLTPNEMAAFREAYALTETEKW